MTVTTLSFSEFLKQTYTKPQLQALCERYQIYTPSHLNKQVLTQKLVTYFDNHSDEIIGHALKDKRFCHMIADTVLKNFTYITRNFDQDCVPWFMTIEQCELVLPREVMAKIKQYFIHHQISVLKIVNQQSNETLAFIIDQNGQYQLPKNRHKIISIYYLLENDPIAKAEYIKMLQKRHTLSHYDQWLLKGLLGHVQHFYYVLRFIDVPWLSVHDDQATQAFLQKMYFFEGLAEMYGLIPIQLVVKLYNHFFHESLSKSAFLNQFETIIENCHVAFFTVSDMGHDTLKDDYYYDPDYTDDGYFEDDEFICTESQFDTIYMEFENNRKKGNYYLPKTLEEVVEIGRYRYQQTAPLITLIQQLQSHMKENECLQTNLDSIIFALRTHFDEASFKSFLESEVQSNHYVGITKDELVQLLSDIRRHLSRWILAGHSDLSLQEKSRK